jgi:enamine deaminase RidA (YjgF/YER057c/UK114 family)
LPDGISAQTGRVIDNLKLVLNGIGLDLEDIVFARIYLTQFERDYSAMNEVWKGRFAPGKLPGRTTVGVTALAVGALVEIDLIARRPEG